MALQPRKLIIFSLSLSIKHFLILLLVWSEMNTELEGLKFMIWKMAFCIVYYFPHPILKTTLLPFRFL
jgi:hypothetical protein